MTLKELYDFVKANLTLNRLKELSQQIIEAYKSRNEAKLKSYAVVLLGGSGEVPETGSRLFFRLIKFFHPDRHNSMLAEVETGYREGDEPKLLFFRDLLSVDSKANRRIAERFGLSHEEEYGVDSRDFGFHAYRPGRHSVDQSVREVRKKFDFASAIKSELYGNLDFDLDLADLASLNDDLDLSDYGLNDLDGLEYCRNIISLNLSGNNIDNLYEIQFLESLKELYLSGNAITDIDELGGLSCLEMADLSDNEIEDVTPLLLLENLKFADISNNPVIDRTVITRLEQKGVVVIF
jgi:Leucine-rich repeat (LRR) protein